MKIIVLDPDLMIEQSYDVYHDEFAHYVIPLMSNNSSEGIFASELLSNTGHLDMDECPEKIILKLQKHLYKIPFIQQQLMMPTCALRIQESQEKIIVFADAKVYEESQNLIDKLQNTFKSCDKVDEGKASRYWIRGYKTILSRRRQFGQQVSMYRWFRKEVAMQQCHDFKSHNQECRELFQNIEVEIKTKLKARLQDLKLVHEKISKFIYDKTLFCRAVDLYDPRELVCKVKILSPQTFEVEHYAINKKGKLISVHISYESDTQQSYDLRKTRLCARKMSWLTNYQGFQETVFYNHQALQVLKIPQEILDWYRVNSEMQTPLPVINIDKMVSNMKRKFEWYKNEKLFSHHQLYDEVRHLCSRMEAILPMLGLDASLYEEAFAFQAEALQIEQNTYRKIKQEYKKEFTDLQEDYAKISTYLHNKELRNVLWAELATL